MMVMTNSALTDTKDALTEYTVLLHYSTDHGGWRNQTSRQFTGATQ